MADDETSCPLSRELVKLAMADWGRLSIMMGEAFVTLCRLEDSLSEGLQHAVEQPLNAPLTRDEIHAAHRRSHQRGGIPKVASDPELELFILQRVDTLTLKEIVTEVAAHFPSERHVSVSSVNRWWLRSGKTLAASRP